MGARTRGLANNVLSSGKLDATDAVSGVIPASNIADASLTSATSYGSVTGGVPQVASDPPSPAEGDIWYNTTSGQIKFVAQAGTWASGGALNTGRHGFLGRAGTQTAALVAAGTEAPASATVNTELYDGSSWTEVNNVNQARQNGGGAGATNTAALIFGGYFPGPGTRYGNTETWNGTNWTEVNDLNSARNSDGSAGTQTSALYFGGFDPSVPGFTGKTESWNGTSWTEVSDLNTARNSFNTFGYSNTAIIAASGSPTPSAVESWNGSSWTEIAELNTAITSAGGSGESTDGLIFGGYTTVEVGNTESWNGSAWTELNDLANVRRNGAGALGGTSSTALYAGGVTPATGYSTVTEEWTFGVTTQIVG